MYVSHAQAYFLSNSAAHKSNKLKIPIDPNPLFNPAIYILSKDKNISSLSHSFAVGPNLPIHEFTARKQIKTRYKQWTINLPGNLRWDLVNRGRYRYRSDGLFVPSVTSNKPLDGPADMHPSELFRTHHLSDWYF